MNIFNFWKQMLLSKQLCSFLERCGFFTRINAIMKRLINTKITYLPLLLLTVILNGQIGLCGGDYLWLYTLYPQDYISGKDWYEENGNVVISNTSARLEKPFLGLGSTNVEYRLNLGNASSAPTSYYFSPTYAVYLEGDSLVWIELKKASDKTWQPYLFAKKEGSWIDNSGWKNTIHYLKVGDFRQPDGKIHMRFVWESGTVYVVAAALLIHPQEFVITGPSEVPPNATTQYQCTAKYYPVNDSSKWRDVTDEVYWKTDSNKHYFGVNNGKLYTLSASGVEPVRITVSGGGDDITATKNISVVPPSYYLRVTSSGASNVSISSSTEHGGTTEYWKMPLYSGTSVSLTAPATVGGTTFSHWSGAVSSNNRTINFNMNNDKEVVANYKPSVFELSVKSSGATNVQIESIYNIYKGITNYTISSILYDTSVNLQAPLTVGNKIFSHWSGAVQSEDRNIRFNVKSNGVITANYVTITYPLSVSSSGASNVVISSPTGHGGTTPYNKTCVQAEWVTLQAPATDPQGYIFERWRVASNDKPAGEKQVSFQMLISYSATAIYTPRTYPVGYLANGATGGSAPAPQAKLHNITLTLQGNSGNLTKSGYAFVGWNTSPDGSGNNYVAGGSYTNNASLTLYAKWAASQYTITFDSNGGTAVAPITKYYNSAVLPPANPTRAGYTFTGWSPAIPAKMPLNGLTCVAQWAVRQYTITFDSNGGTAVAPITQDYNSAITAPANPTKAGYTFTGWNPAVPAKMPVNGLTCIAQWGARQYTITFDSNGGTAVAPITKEYNAAVSPPANPTKAGYTFTGWNPAVPATMPLNGKTCVAEWKVNQYTITFDSNGGTAVAPITKDYNSAITPPAAPTKAGYTFTGWNPAVPAKMPLDGLTCVAQWKANQYTITFNSNGGSSVPSITKDYNSAITPPAAPTKAGYTFTGWSPAIPPTMPMNSLTCVAQWKANQYTITFNSNGGSSVPSITKDYNSAITPPAAPTKAGYTFTGWNPAVPAKMPVNGLTCIAQWGARQYTITFDSNGGTAVAPITKDYNSAITPPAAPTKAGYTFTGWNPAIPPKMPINGTTCVAQWAARQYTITFDSNGGTAVVPITQDYNSAITPPDNPTKAGYTFTGWNPAVPAKMPINGATCVAQWKANQYTITFDSNGGTAVAPITADYNSAVTAPANPTKAGYTFTGWQPAVPAKMPLNGLACVAQWIVTTYSVTFDLGEHGTRIGGGELQQSVREGQAAEEPLLATELGWSFVQWDCDFQNIMGALTVRAVYSYSYSLHIGWNLISINITLTEKSQQLLYTKKAMTLSPTGNAYVFNGNLTPTQACWIYCQTAETITLAGTSPENFDYAANLNKGWNFVGPITDSLLNGDDAIAWGWDGQNLYPRKNMGSGSGYYLYWPEQHGEVAPLNGEYLVIDLSGGPSARSYPIDILTAPPAGGWTDEYKTTKLVLRRIPAGTFMMGSPTGELGRLGSETQHQVTLTQDFYIGVFEITQKQWALVMGTWPSGFRNAAYRDTRPVERASYDDIRGIGAGSGWPANGAVDTDSFMGR
ncbi:MAG: InlB B-repeat-containing protein, partial [Lentisphaeria bacterium]|nr:InlB B-repeat-containing protein [Lentisphaeria bacterium]